MTERPPVQDLLVAYVRDELDADERRRVESAVADDAALADELDQLRELLADLRTIDAEVVTAPAELPDGFVERTESRLRDEVAAEATRRTTAVASRFTAAAASVVLVAAIAVGVVRLGTEPDPGLGVREEIAMEVVDPDLEVTDAAVVPHTWGTEVFFTVSGTDDLLEYRVDLVGHDGTRVSAGTFLGDADLEVVCIMNGALLREDVEQIVIETADGEQVLIADLDEVAYTSV